MKVLFATSECAPFVKAGGLADVSLSLPAALQRRGVDVCVVLPNYRNIAHEWTEKMKRVTLFAVDLGWRKQRCSVDMLQHEGITYYFLGNDYYFARNYIYGTGNEDGERFSFFCKAILEVLPEIDFFPDIIHCNDWQTGMVPALLKTQYAQLPDYKDIKTVFTIHNLNYQGMFPWDQIDDYLSIGCKYFTPEKLEFYGCANFMKAGIVFADTVSTVSPSYAAEIQTPFLGERMDGLLRARQDDFTGILNGLDKDVYDPMNDPYIAAGFSVMDLMGKGICKAALQEELGLDIRPDVPLIGMVTRFADQKGLDLIECVLEDILSHDVQLAVIGVGARRYADMFSWATWRYPGRIGARFEHNEAVARRIYAGSDLFLMPSLYEPCGLSQMIALRYGAVPIVRETGGLRDTISPYNKYSDEGNGFSFANYNAQEMLDTIMIALDYYNQDKPLWQRLVRRGMSCDFSWDVSAGKYLSIYDKVLK